MLVKKYFEEIETYKASIIRLFVRSSGGLPDGEPESLAQGGRYGITDLPVLLDRGSVELIRVGETLAPGTLSDRHNPVMNAISKRDCKKI